MLKLYNTLTRKKEIFKPLKDKRVNLFVCGPTVYDYSHLGHGRTYIIFDALAKYLKQLGYSVFYLQNITDIDDKIIERAKEEKKKPRDLAGFFEKEYLKDMKALNIGSVDKYARATAHIKEIISQVERLLERGLAYQISDGIYYDIKKFKDYGKLSGRTALQAEDAVSRIDEVKGKRNKGDFCLWKFSKPDEPKWPSPFGEGRPGWHIEDTAITEKYFGAQYDIHGGANELIFPHHEAEIAQMEAISGKKPLVRYWLHTGILTIKGVKMSKSLKNFISIRDFLKKYSYRVLRLFVLKSHYRSPVDYNERAIKQTEKELERIDEFVGKISHFGSSALGIFFEGNFLRDTLGAAPSAPAEAAGADGAAPSIWKKFPRRCSQFHKAMNDDFNTPQALAMIFDLIKKGNKLIEQNKLNSSQAKEIYNLMLEFDKVLGILPTQKKSAIPQEIKKLVKEREKARRKKDWVRADQIRRQIEKKGYKIEDTPKEAKVKKV